MLKSFISLTVLRYPLVIKVAAAFILIASWISMLVTNLPKGPTMFVLFVFTPFCATCYFLAERYYVPLVFALCFVHISFIALTATYFYLLSTGLMLAALFDVTVAGLLLGGLGATLATFYTIFWIIFGEVATHGQWISRPPRSYVESNLAGYIANAAVASLIILANYVVIVFFAYLVRKALTDFRGKQSELERALAELNQHQALQLETADAVSMASHLLSSETQAQASGAQQQAAAVEQVSVVVSQLDHEAGSIAERAQQVSDLANRVSSSAGTSKRLIDEVAAAMGLAHQGVAHIVENSTELGLQVQEIAKVVELLSSIAKETHILSLNAAIEAAGASDSIAGQRFTVVATQIEELAQRAAQATEQVQGIIIQVQSAAKSTSVASFESMVETERSVAGLSRASTVAEFLSELAEEANQSAQAILGGVEEQRRGSAQVASSIRQISGVAEYNASGSGHLLQATAQLSKLVARFVSEAPTSSPTARAANIELRLAEALESSSLCEARQARVCTQGGHAKVSGGTRSWARSWARRQGEDRAQTGG